MPSAASLNLRLKTVGLLALLLPAPVWGQSAGGQLRIPDRAPTSLFRGDQGKQRTEAHYDPARGLVTIKLLVQDAQGYFIPGIRRENIAVYEDDVRQNNVMVDIEHATVTLGLLLEYGGHQPSVNRDLLQEVVRGGRQFLDALGQQDQLAVWAYGDTVRQLAGFSRDRQAFTELFFNLKPPEVSETNLYDALIATLGNMKPVSGRKAIILLSSGVDTFSKASFDDARAAAANGDTPIYAVSLEPALRQDVLVTGAQNPFARVNWQDVDDKLLAIAKAAGGRMYSPSGTLDLSPTYDDIMENLRIRYVITYKSSNAGTAIPHTVRIELVDPRTGKPLEIMDSQGRAVRASPIPPLTWTRGR